MSLVHTHSETSIHLKKNGIHKKTSISLINDQEQQLTIPFKVRVNYIRDAPLVRQDGGIDPDKHHCRTQGCPNGCCV